MSDAPAELAAALTTWIEDSDQITVGVPIELARPILAALESVATPTENFYPNGIAHLMPPVTLNAYQLRWALELANPDGPNAVDQLETEVSIQFKLDGKDTDGEDAPAGLYAWLTEYPEEGSLFLDPLTPLARSAA